MSQPFSQALAQWFSIRSLGKRPRTQEFYRDHHHALAAAWPRGRGNFRQLGLQCAQFVAHHCPPRWNSIVAALRSITPQGRHPSRRRANLRAFNPPSPDQFTALLEECDQMPRTQAGLMLRMD